jgi:hypothetical protein
MALEVKLGHDLGRRQQLVMTRQLQQAIKILQTLPAGARSAGAERKGGRDRRYREEIEKIEVAFVRHVRQGWRTTPACNASS